MKRQIIAAMIVCTGLAISACGNKENAAEEGSLAISDASSEESTEDSADNASTKSSEEESSASTEEAQTISPDEYHHVKAHEPQNLREKHQVVGTMDQADGYTLFYGQMNTSEYNFFDDETFEYEWLGKDSKADYSQIPQQSIKDIAMEVVDDHGYNKVSGLTKLGNDYDDEYYYLVFDDTYYLEVVYNPNEQGAYAILEGYDLPEDVEKVPSKYADWDAYEERHKVEVAKKAEEEKNQPEENAATAVTTFDDGVTLMSNGELIGTDSPDIIGPKYGFEFEDYDKLIDAGLNLPATYIMKQELSNYLTDNNLDPYSAGTVNYVAGSFTSSDTEQTFEVTVSGYPDLLLKATYVIKDRTITYENVK